MQLVVPLPKFTLLKQLLMKFLLSDAEVYCWCWAKLERAAAPENTGVEAHIGVAACLSRVHGETASIFEGGDLRFSTNLAGSLLL